MFSRYEVFSCWRQVSISCLEIKNTPLRPSPGVLAMVLNIFTAGLLTFAGSLAQLPSITLDQQQAPVAGQETVARLPEEANVYSKHIQSAARKHKVDPHLITAIIETESKGNPMALSSKGAKGLMQITSVVCRKYEVKNPFDVEQNINAGTAYLAYLMDHLDGDLERSLAAYNCGLGKVLNYNGIPPLRETKQFVRRTMESYKIKKNFG